ncbi:MAG TPA: DUF411 domain-containing protein [Nevskiaceae bacterium]|nr:DUF411 domain-containing protein [Nevskiaceae bacterium]
MHHVLDVPEDLQSHHTAITSGYIIEGHVPAEDITRLLLEKPDLRGIAVPGIQGASPGMEDFSNDRRPYRVVAFDRDSRISSFAAH